MISPNTNKLGLVKTQKLLKNPNLKQFICKNCSYQCAYDCVQLCYTIQHRTVLTIFPVILQTIIIAQMLSNGVKQDGACLEFLKQPSFREMTSCQLHSDGEPLSKCLSVCACVRVL